MIKIDKGVPLPALPLPSSPYKYPWNDMREVGDSFFVNGCGDRNKLTKLVQNLRSSGRSWGDRHNMKFVVAREKSGARVWRVK